MSHTVSMRVEIKDPEAFEAAVKAIGGTFLGHGRFWAGTRNAEGLGATLPDFYGRIVAADGQLYYDGDNKTDQLERLKGEYALQRAAKECDALGYYWERDGAALTVHHPDGGTLMITADGTIDAQGFTGANCAAATAPLEAALGIAASSQRKAEYNALHIEQQQG